MFANTQTNCAIHQPFTLETPAIPQMIQYQKWNLLLYTVFKLSKL